MNYVHYQYFIMATFTNIKLPHIYYLGDKKGYAIENNITIMLAQFQQSSFSE